jgi:hypothetical protein
LLSLESLSLTLFTNEVFSRTARPIPPLLNSASHDDATAGKIDFRLQPLSISIFRFPANSCPAREVF